MNISDASMLFSRAENVRTQLDFICRYKAVSEIERKKFEYLIKALDKIYMSADTKRHRQDLSDFIIHNGEKIYKKYTELSNVVLKNIDNSK